MRPCIWNGDGSLRVYVISFDRPGWGVDGVDFSKDTDDAYESSASRRGGNGGAGGIVRARAVPPARSLRGHHQQGKFRGKVFSQKP